MPIKIEIDRNYLTDALEGKIASLKRANTNEKNPLMKELRDKDIAHISNAMNTMTEAK